MAVRCRRDGAFMATTIAFFIAEIGDKTQVATVLLAAKYSPLWQVVAGTTLGMLAGERAGGGAGQPLRDRGCRCVRRGSRRRCVFLALGLWALYGAF